MTEPLSGGLVLMVKVACVLPAGTVTLAGTLARLGLLLTSDTTTGLVGAALRVTVPVEVPTPLTLVGFTVRLVSTGLVGGGAVPPEKIARPIACGPPVTPTRLMFSTPSL